MVLAVPEHPIAGAQFLKLAEDERNHMLNLLVGIFGNTVIREAYQASGQTLHILSALHFTQTPRIEPLAHQIEFGLRHRTF
jgi:hypothetical protein